MASLGNKYKNIYMYMHELCCGRRCFASCVCTAGWGVPPALEGECRYITGKTQVPVILLICYTFCTLQSALLISALPDLASALLI